MFCEDFNISSGIGCADYARVVSAKVSSGIPSSCATACSAGASEQWILMTMRSDETCFVFVFFGIVFCFVSGD